MESSTLEEKINKIRLKNEEIRRRHEEVEADKQNAAKLNALVKMVPPTDWPERKEPPEFSNPPTPRSNGNFKPKVSGREYRGQQQQYHAGGGEGKKTHVFADGDGPPPDPTYNFLADSEREERTREDIRDNDRSRGRGGPVRGSSRRRGGGRDGYSKEYRGSPGQKDASKPEYDAWRAERNRIDEARISRQRTAEGNWRREWDNNKINVEEDEAGATKSPRLDQVDGVRKEHREFDKWQADGIDHDSPRGRGGKQYINRGGLRGSHNNRAYQHSNSFEQFHGPVSPAAIKQPPSPNGIDERTVVATDKSIKVIVNHGHTTAPKGPVMSVKVSSSSIAGTGRVGPRQKPRVLYSSQSESEALGHDDKFSGHKSPEDKTNRVSFNRDVDEQQRYVPKSPHPPRKGDGNQKSPFLNRKEFKYDSQQQRHAESNPKSPYLQRKEIKDCPKSPNFQKKGDIANRDSHAKQKNNNSTADSFKSNHSLRRSSEKTKQDSQKFSGPKKFEDPAAPKPQRTNRRTDKSKTFQHNNSKEARDPNESKGQTTILGTVEESAKNIANGNESLEEGKSTVNNCEDNLSQDSVRIETVKENQNDDDDVSKLNINTEGLNLSTDLKKVSESVSDGTKLIDNSEPMIETQKDCPESPESMNVSYNETEEAILVESTDVSTAAESATLDPPESKVNECCTAAESATLDRPESKIDECYTAAESEALNPPESKINECYTAAESATPNPPETMIDECSENVDDVRHIQESSEITGAVREEIETEIVSENGTKNCENEATNIQDVANDVSKHEENSISSTHPDNLGKVEVEIVTKESELQSETQDEISSESEKIENDMEQARERIESTISSVKENLSVEVETHQNVGEGILENIEKQVVKDTDNQEKSVI